RGLAPVGGVACWLWVNTAFTTPAWANASRTTRLTGATTARQTTPTTALPLHVCQPRARRGRSITNVETTIATQRTRQISVITAARVSSEGSTARSRAARRL